MDIVKTLETDYVCLLRVRRFMGRWHSNLAFPSHASFLWEKWKGPCFWVWNLIWPNFVNLDRCVSFASPMLHGKVTFKPRQFPLTEAVSYLCPHLCATEKGHLHLLICNRYLIPCFDLYHSNLIAAFLRLQTYHLINTLPEGPHCAGYGASLGGPKTLKCNILRVFLCLIL